MEIAIAVLVLGGLGLICGLVLAVAGQVFAVEVDPREEQLMEIIPGANCGACGYAGCAGYVKAVVSGESQIGRCPVGGAALKEKMTVIMKSAEPSAQ